MPLPLPFLHLLHLLRPRIRPTIYRRSHCQRAANDGADADEEGGEALGALLAVDDFHGRDVYEEVGVSWVCVC